MVTPQDVLDLAKAHVGEKETGDNAGEIVQWSCNPWLPKGWDVSKPHPETKKMGWAAWCAGFVSTCYLRAGYPMQKLGSLSVTTLYNRCVAAIKTEKVKNPDGYTPSPADLIFFQDKTGELVHVGLVRFSDEKNVYTIEGNSKNAISQNQYDKKNPKIFKYINLF